MTFLRWAINLEYVVVSGKFSQLWFRDLLVVMSEPIYSTPPPSEHATTMSCSSAVAPERPLVMSFPQVRTQT